MSTGDLETPIERMYRAGKEYIPDQAQRLAIMDGHLRSGMSAVNTFSAQLGDPAVMTQMLGVCDMVHAALRRGVISLNDCALAMIATADDFVASDTQALTDFSALSEDLVDGPPRQASEPPVGIPAEDEGATEEHRDERGVTRTEETPSTPDPEATPEEDLDERDQLVEDNEPEQPESDR